MAIYKSRLFWLSSTSASSLAAWCWWDRRDADQQWQSYCQEARALGDAPHPISLDGRANEPLRRLSLLLPAVDADEGRRQRRIFRELVAPLLTHAGIDYHLIEEKGDGDELATDKLKAQLPILLHNEQVQRDGLVSLNVTGYTCLLESIEGGVQPRVGLINCDVDPRLRDRLYWSLNRRQLIRLVGEETMRVIRDETRSMTVKEALPSSLSTTEAIAHVYQ